VGGMRGLSGVGCGVNTHCVLGKWAGGEEGSGCDNACEMSKEAEKV
jgi:hypothetical protein